MHGDFKVNTDRLKFAVVGAGAAGFLNSRILTLFFDSLSKENDSNELPHITLYESNNEVIKGASQAMARRQGAVHFIGDANRRVIQQGINVLKDIFTRDHHFSEKPSTAAKLPGGIYAVGNEANASFNPNEIIAGLEAGIANKSLPGVSRIPEKELDNLFGASEDRGTMRKQ